MQQDYCLPFVSTTISIGVSVLLGAVAVAHFFGKEKLPPPKTSSKGVQTDSCDTDAKRKKEISSLLKQVKHQKTVACNMEEENECLAEQVCSQLRCSEDAGCKWGCVGFGAVCEFGDQFVGQKSWFGCGGVQCTVGEFGSRVELL